MEEGKNGAVLQVKGLRTYFYTDEGVVKAVDNLSYHVSRGECVGLAQIAGQCGKFQPSAKSPIGGLFYTGSDVGIAGMGTHKASGGGINTARMVLQYHRLRQSTL